MIGNKKSLRAQEMESMYQVTNNKKELEQVKQTKAMAPLELKFIAVPYGVLRFQTV